MTTMSPAQRRNFTWQCIGLALLVAALIGLGSALPARAGRSMARLSHNASVTRQQIAAANQLQQHLLDAETGQRGYLLTDRSDYLKPFADAASLIEPDLEKLRAGSADTPWMMAEVAELIPLAVGKLTELRETVALAQAGDRAGAMAIVTTDYGKRLMDDIHTRVERLTDRLDQADMDQSALLQDRQARLTLMTQAATMVGIMLLGVALVIALWNRALLATTQLGQRVVSDRLAAAIDRIRDGIAVFDAQDTLILRNDQLARVLGLTPEQAHLGRTWASLAAAAELDPATAFTSNQDEPAEIVLNGRTLEVRLGEMPDGGRILSVADITRRVTAEEIARHAHKMEVLGQMTGGIAHDFNNLLQVVSANLELAGNRLARAERPDAWIQTRLDAARSGVIRGARLTQHLLAFARRQPLAPESVDPSRLLIGLEDMLRRTVGSPIELQLVTSGGLWPVRADPNQIENALLNLALNGRDAIGTSGTANGCLTIEATNATLDATYAEQAGDVTAGAYVVFSVTDNGTGMSRDQIARATEPFYTTKPDGQGTGLGLSMVFGFAKQSGGHFKLYSEEGRGTTAKLYLPRSDTPADSALSPAGTDQRRGTGEIILLVEDDLTVRTSGAEVLRSLGYSVVEAPSAADALALIMQGLRPNVLFTDVVMPGRLNARSLAERAVSIVPGLPVLFTSGYTQNAIVHNGTLDAGITLISKPWRLDELARALRRALDEPRPASPTPASPTPASPIPAPAVRAARTVLLVEDEPLIRMTTADTLTDLGYDVIQAADGAEALAQTQAADLVLLDLGLPDMPGLVVAERMRAAHPGLRIVIASGQAAATPGYRWLPKPYDAAALTSVLAQAWSDPA